MKSFDEHCTGKLNENRAYYLSDVVSTDLWKRVSLLSLL